MSTKALKSPSLHAMRYFVYNEICGWPNNCSDIHQDIAYNGPENPKDINLRKRPDQV